MWFLTVHIIFKSSFSAVIFNFFLKLEMKCLLLCYLGKSLFDFTCKILYLIYRMWKAGTGPVKDLYNIGDNPQFCLDLKSSGSTIWVLLTRHIVDRVNMIFYFLIIIIYCKTKFTLCLYYIIEARLHNFWSAYLSFVTF